MTDTAAETTATPESSEITIDSPFDDIVNSLTEQDFADAVTNEPIADDMQEGIDKTDVSDSEDADDTADSNTKTTDESQTEDSETDAEAVSEESDESEETPKPGDKYSKAFLKLAEKEKKFQQWQDEQRRQMSQQQADLQAASQALHAINSKDPSKIVEGLAAFGIDFSELAIQVAAENDPTTDAGINKFKQEIEALKRQNQEIQRQAQLQQQQAVANQYISEYNALLKSEKYEPIRAYYDFIGASPASEVGEIYDHFYKNQNKHLTPQDMADILLTEASNRLKKFGESPTTAKFLKPIASEKTVASERTKKPDANPKTQSTEQPPEANWDDLSLEERNQFVMNNWF